MADTYTDPYQDPNKVPKPPVVPGQPVAAPPLTTNTPAQGDWTPQEANLAGLGWVDKNHPLYGTAGFVGPRTAAAPAPAPTGGAPTGGTPAGNITQQGRNAETYSGTPGAAPTNNTTNQGTQDVVRNSYLERAMQPVDVDPRTNSAIRTQSDAYAAASERARRDQTADLAEATAGTGQTGLQDTEQRLINERAAQGRGQFEASLVSQELQTKRTEVAQALESLKGMISDDQTRALQDRLAQLDAQLKTASLNASTGLGQAELALKDKLGMAGINVDLASLLQNNDQFNKTLGFNIGDREAYWNNAALDQILG